MRKARPLSTTLAEWSQATKHVFQGSCKPLPRCRFHHDYHHHISDITSHCWAQIAFHKEGAWAIAPGSSAGWKLQTHHLTALQLCGGFVTIFSFSEKLIAKELRPWCAACVIISTALGIWQGGNLLERQLSTYTWVPKA